MYLCTRCSAGVCGTHAVDGGVCEQCEAEAHREQILAQAAKEAQVRRRHDAWVTDSGGSGRLVADREELRELLNRGRSDSVRFDPPDALVWIAVACVIGGPIWLGSTLGQANAPEGEFHWGWFWLVVLIIVVVVPAVVWAIHKRLRRKRSGRVNRLRRTTTCGQRGCADCEPFKQRLPAPY